MAKEAQSETATETRPEVRPEDVIRLDRTRTTTGLDPWGKTMRIPDYSTVHGDRREDDPHVRVVYMQDGLPFDGEGRLVPDDGRTGPWTVDAEASDGKPIKINYRPLYDAAMRAKVKKKMDRLARTIKSAAPSADDLAEDIQEREAASDAINLTDWLQGDAECPPYMVYAAIKKRYGMSVTSIEAAVRFLIMDEQVMHGSQVRQEFQRHLRNAA